MTIRRFFHSLARLLRRAIEPSIEAPAVGAFESRWLRHWRIVTAALARYDDGRSCEFVYQSLALVAAIDGLSVAAARELLDATLGAHVAAQHHGANGGKWPTYTSLDARRMDAIRQELRHRRGKRVMRVIRPQLDASPN